MAEIDFWMGSEAERLASQAVPPQMTIAVSAAQKLFLGDGVTPVSALVEPYARTADVAAFMAAISAQVQAVSGRSVPAPRSLIHPISGTLAIGLCERSAFVESGFTVGVVRARLDRAPTGAAAIVQIVEAATSTVLYTLTIPDGSTAVDDTAAGFVISDADQLQFNVTQIGATKAGGGLVIELAQGTGSSSSSGIGTVSTVSADSVGAASVSLSWLYVGDPPSTFAVVTKPGTAPPSSPTDGTVLTVDGSASTAKPLGLTAATAYSFGVWPVAQDGTLGTPGTLTNIITGSIDNTPPGQVTSTSYTAGSTALTLSWTNPTDADFDHLIARIKLNTSVVFGALTAGAQPTEGHPAATTSPGASGSGTALPAGATTFTQTNLSPTTHYVIGLFSVDASGNINPTPVSVVCTTSAAATTGQGDNGVIPATYNNLATDTFGVTNPLAHYQSTQGYAKPEQGPSAHDNVDTAPDPNPGTQISGTCLRMRQRNFTGPFDSNSAVYKNDPNLFVQSDGTTHVTTGTGWYGARFGSSLPSQASGASEITWKITNLDGSTATALGNNTKGFTWMWFPDKSWPKDELDIIEIFSASALQANMHYLSSTGDNGQVHSLGGNPFNIFDWITTTCLWEPAPAGTGGTSGGVGRIRVFHKQAGVAGDSGTGTPKTWFDTNKPYVGFGPGTNPPTDDAIQRLLSQANPGGIGAAVAWVPGSIKYTKATTTTAENITGATFGCTTGTGANQRQGHAVYIRKISWWAAA